MWICVCIYIYIYIYIHIYIYNYVYIYIYVYIIPKENADPEAVKANIAANYPLFGMPTDAAVAQLSAQRPSSAKTVRCNRYHRVVDGVSSALLMGDAAHSTGMYLYTYIYV
jgi:hypothetical protein